VPRLRLVGMRSSVRERAMSAPNSVQMEPEETIQVIFTEKGTSFIKVKDRKPVEIRVVEDHPCPFCGAKFPTGRRSTIKMVGGGDATQKSA